MQRCSGNYIDSHIDGLVGSGDGDTDESSGTGACVLGAGTSGGTELPVELCTNFSRITNTAALEMCTNCVARQCRERGESNQLLVLSGKAVPGRR